MKRFLTVSMAFAACLSVSSCDSGKEDTAPEVSGIRLSDVNLWTNSATVDAGDAGSLSYREKGTEEWVPAEKKDGKFVISPVWEKSKNEAGLDTYTLKEGTGIFAGNIYEFQTDGQALAAEYDYEAAAGDVIPNSDMSGWSTIGDKEKPLPYPNADPETVFWTSGNNVYNYPLFGEGEPTFLCQEDNGAALLQSTAVLGAVYAAGNLFAGTFEQVSTSGVASFGQSYSWKARPKALKIRVRYELGNIDLVGPNDPLKEQLEQEKPADKARIYVSVTDWSDRHPVKSGLGVNPDEMNVWDPAGQTDTEEGAILGYASIYFEGTQSEFKEVIIPFNWYDTVTKPSPDKISLGIACTTSYRGDYLTGCKSNKLWVDDFEWVY